MKRAKRNCYLLGLAFATLSTVGIAAADQPSSQAPSQMTIAQKMSATATIAKIDTDKRDLMLKDDQGNEFMVQVPEDVTRFDALKKGDHIKIDYYQSVGLSLKKGEAGKPGAHETTMAERNAGKLPGGLVARKITGSAEVMKVDTTENKVTIKGPNGEMDTINVTDPALKADLAKLKKGDRIQASYTEAVAISVTPQEEKK
jgi:Cu/Ag efflux protein CusF